MPYFHGIVLFAGKWFRLLTNVKHTPGTSVKESFEGGPYKPAFLDHFFAGGYRVEVRKIHGRKFDGIKSAPASITRKLDSGEVLRFSNASDQYTIRIKGSNGWLSAFNEVGLLISNSKKMPKRLTELVRLSCMWLFRSEGNALKMEVIDHVALGMPDEYVDGATAISRGVAIQCVKSNTSASRSWKARMIWRIISGELTVVQIRMICKEGLLKGNALILPKRMMNGFDLRTFAPNIKPEVRSTGWQWLTLEPSYGAIPVKSDDLTHAIYRNVKGLYDDDTLLSCLEESLKQFKADLMDGKRSEWMEKLADNADEILHEDAEEKFTKDRGLVARIQLAVAQLSKLGVPLNASQTLMYLSVGGLRNQLLGDKASGMVWTDKTRHWFPVPWAYAAHIYTKEVLEVFGFEMPNHARGFFHKETHSFVVPGAFFKKNFSNHGGPDLDDTVKVHIRRILLSNGRTQMMGFILRNPNDFGEWSMIPIDRIGPVFHKYGQQPPLVDLQELNTNVPQFSKLRRQLNIGSLPAIITPRQRGDVFSLEDEETVRLASQMFPAGVGGTVIPKMIWYAQFGTYITDLVASNEDIIDVLQQGQAGSDDVTLIKNWVDKTFVKMGEQLNFTMSPFWYYTRLPVAIKEEMGWSTPDDIDSCSWVRLHRTREYLVRQYLKEMTDWLNTNVVMPEVLTNITWTSEEIQKAPGELDSLIKAYKLSRGSSESWAETFVSMLKESDEKFGEERTDRKVLRLAHQAIVRKGLLPSANHDQWLYSFTAKDEVLPYTYYVRALKRLQNGTYNW